MLNTQTPAPDFEAVDQHNQPVRLSDFRDKKNVVLYFYPKDDTPGCTIEANDFTTLASDFRQNNTVVIGVSKDDCNSHQAFIDKFNLDLILLADTSGEVCERYDVWQQLEYNGKQYMGIKRSTFIIDKSAQLVYASYDVNPNKHAQKVLNIIKNQIKAD